MNPHHVRIFISIARTKSLSSTARALHFTQPAVTAALNQLEKELGVQLVVRGRGVHQVRLTSAGEALLPIAHRWLEVEQQVEYYKQMQKSKVLRLGANSAGHEYVVGYVVQKLRQRLPDLKIQLVDVPGLEIGTAVDNNTFDITFFYGKRFTRTSNGTPINAIELSKEEYYVVCPTDSNLPDRPLLPSDLDPRLEIYCCANSIYSNYYRWRETALPVDKGAAIAVENISAIPAYLTVPGSWALLPASIARAKIASSEGRLTYRRLETPPPTRSLCLLISKAYLETAVIQEFLECCSEYVDERAHLIRPPDFQL